MSELFGTIKAPSIVEGAVTSAIIDTLLHISEKDFRALDDAMPKCKKIAEMIETIFDEADDQSEINTEGVIRELRMGFGWNEEEAKRAAEILFLSIELKYCILSWGK